MAGPNEVSGARASGCRGAIEALFRTDLDLKRSAGDPRVLLERLVVELCGRRQRAVRARVGPTFRSGAIRPS